MKHHATTVMGGCATIPKQPFWITSGLGETPQNIAFLSGARFAILDVALRQGGDTIPMDLLVNTLALKAAVSTSKLEGRMAREADMRDAFFLAAPGEALGPDGDMLAFWRSAARLRLHGGQWNKSLNEVIDPSLSAAAETILSDASNRSESDGPMAVAVHAMTEIILIDDRAEKAACLVSDMVLARFLGWGRVLPLTALHLTKANLRDLRNHKPNTALKIEAAISQSAETAHVTASKLARKADALRAVAPKLRSKGSDDAVNVFLTENAVAPSGMLSPTIRGTRTKMTGRAARRLCDRLVELGVVKELTGRSTFRMYGLAP